MVSRCPVSLDSDTFRAHNSLALASKARYGHFSLLRKTRTTQPSSNIHQKFQQASPRSILDTYHFESRRPIRKSNCMKLQAERLFVDFKRETWSQNNSDGTSYSNGRSSLSRMNEISLQTAIELVLQKLQFHCILSFATGWSPSKYARTKRALTIMDNQNPVLMSIGIH